MKNTKIGDEIMSKVAIIDFLKRCIKYADESIHRKKGRSESDSIITEWQAYRDYTQYALDEIEKGELDHWLNRESILAENELEMDELDHSARSEWLSALISPRPLALVSTRNNEGKENLAPITSLSVVSNSPPLIVMSLSKNRDGIPRDTYSNLIENNTCELQFIAASLEAAKDVDLAGSITVDSEWDLLESEGPVHPLAVAVLHCTLLEDNPLPEGAVARLLTLRVDKAIVPSYLPPENGLSILCQHGLDRLTPSPQDWGHKATKHRQ